eukprot:1159584-Pelagomonas_calceolata.AAC.16
MKANTDVRNKYCTCGRAGHGNGVLGQRSHIQANTNTQRRMAPAGMQGSGAPRLIYESSFLVFDKGKWSLTASWLFLSFPLPGKKTRTCAKACNVVCTTLDDVQVMVGTSESAMACTYGRREGAGSAQGVQDHGP